MAINSATEDCTINQLISIPKEEVQYQPAVTLFPDTPRSPRNKCARSKRTIAPHDDASLKYFRRVSSTTCASEAMSLAVSFIKGHRL